MALTVLYTVKEFLDKVRLALDSRTVYVYGGFGAPLNFGNNLTRYTTNNSYNKKNAAKIKAAAEKAKADGVPIFGGDCHCTIKGIAWGWNADCNKGYGGAVYPTEADVKAGKIPDCSINIHRDKYCEPYSTDFSNIVAGEALFLDEEGTHFGVYLGDGMVAENTPKWDNCFQISELWNVKKTSNKGRKWWAHAKMKWIDYTAVEALKTPVEQRNSETPTDIPQKDEKPVEPVLEGKRTIVCPCCGKTIWNDGTKYEEFVIYTVKSGDSLWGIAAKNYGKGSKYTIICEDNKDVIRASNTIYPGDKLKIRKDLIV